MKLCDRSTLSRRSLQVLLLLVVVMFILVSSPTTIIPPASPVAPITIYVTNYGYHGRLVIPTREGQLLQYTYGDWDYFALNRQNLNQAIAALLIPTSGTLGRRKFENLSQLQQTLGSNWQDILLSFEVSSSSVLTLEQSLGVRFKQNIATSVFNPHHGLTFVKDERNYSMFHNSNHELVFWLEQLDCKVRGFVALPNYQVRNP
ncbi:MAG: DUF2459 domain-containing protein [Cyanobacteria bacterium P01_G01_bin.67]